MGHRIERDKRITSHLGLVARAFGADGIILEDIGGSYVEKTVKKVVDRFGGKFFVKVGEPSLKVVQDWKNKGGEIVHLTFYGLALPEVIGKIRASPKDKLVVVGASKVPREIYDLATYNVSVTNQPHSEIAALAVFLDHLFEGREFKKRFQNAELEIIPSKDGKKVRHSKEKDL
jgi:tRNA (cytidine56-2'-O)-methyltransferase